MTNLYIEDILNQLKVLQKNRKKNGFLSYKNEIAHLFGIDTSKPINEAEIIFLAGFVEGEGSINVALKKCPATISGVTLDLNFSITQHVNGISCLHKAMRYFGTGSIRHKGDNSAIMFYEIGDRKAIRTKVVPFFQKVVLKYGSAGKRERFEKFEKLLKMLEEGEHKDKNQLINNMLPIWDELRMQTEQSNQTFESLSQAQKWVHDCWDKTSQEKEQIIKNQSKKKN